jgi:hypothetical protein
MPHFFTWDRKVNTLVYAYFFVNHFFAGGGGYGKFGFASVTSRWDRFVWQLSEESPRVPSEPRTEPGTYEYRAVCRRSSISTKLCHNLWKDDPGEAC